MISLYQREGEENFLAFVFTTEGDEKEALRSQINDSLIKVKVAFILPGEITMVTYTKHITWLGVIFRVLSPEVPRFHIVIEMYKYYCTLICC